MLFACEKPVEKESFTNELEQLREYFHIPGMAVIVTKGDQTLYENYMGFADVEKQQPMDSLTTIPMASLTKIFAAMLVLQLSDRGVLERPISYYVPDAGVGDSVKVKHVLSHTSQGDVGKHFYYSGRYRWLTKVIEKEHGASYKSIMNAAILLPFELDNTYLMGDTIDIGTRKIAKPYVFEGETKPGFIDYGYSSASGIASTVRDLARLSRIIDNNGILTEEMKREMFTPRDVDRTYGYGVFVQEVSGHEVIWAYGQYDCYSSLFLKVPDMDLAFVIAANNSLMSDPARMIYGDVSTSLFALSFMKNFMDLDLKSIKAKALADSYIARYEPARADSSKVLLAKFFSSMHTDNSTGDLALLHNLMFLKEVAIQKDQPGFNDYDQAIQDISAKLLRADPNNPYANYYLARHYEIKNMADSATLYYRRIVDAKNFDKNWYTRVAEAWLRGSASPSATGTTARPRE